ncbi:MAG: hypothetical protein A2351_05000 [Omnitrophica bacterium RIFOXYB12_FULL_50_7]|nr:MAG: hypothetical protein A2351_05000 [Omnitrophica bacterium RIFOXYB12_FULL_50_7]
MKRSLFLLAVFILGLGIASVTYAYEGYEEGRKWAVENGVIDDDYHSDNSEAFDNGVRQYAIEQQQLQRQREK